MTPDFKIQLLWVAYNILKDMALSTKSIRKAIALLEAERSKNADE